MSSPVHIGLFAADELRRLAFKTPRRASHIIGKFENALSNRTYSIYTVENENADHEFTGTGWSEAHSRIILNLRMKNGVTIGDNKTIIPADAIPSSHFMKILDGAKNHPLSRYVQFAGQDVDRFAPGGITGICPLYRGGSAYAKTGDVWEVSAVRLEYETPSIPAAPFLAELRQDIEAHIAGQIDAQVDA